MVSRRLFMLGLVAAAMSPRTALAARSHKHFVLNRKYAPHNVAFPFEYDPGMVVVDPYERFLYLITRPGTARRYGVGVGKAGLAWSGYAYIGRKEEWPHWRPTDDMIRRDPRKYAKYADGVDGGPRNPLGARALYLYGEDGRDTMYRIHGTNEPWTIGRAVSNGCIRMLNAHVEDLYDRVEIGTPVLVL
ncbi:lipoprotein-anchoring transpeptidase ErfK/SrfK [Pseudaminobacter salicylatoxidans]|uniref:Lipoprotein-anchoring transpeptidase ErfK/SrfK n=1 Tax=Pseudaminobacter salicylatoxidans TaxID=93369 RepID=A0A316C0W4_PSESE|nr:L,D-transpeptidase [Pseudaminobacter salicylatoxidans]PWJ80498.1 lipoprotein-anchoring transpeptidase ErfK/SrfK [Pseudaminobacter salicylatoxidans]